MQGSQYNITYHRDGEADEYQECWRVNFLVNFNNYNQSNQEFLLLILLGPENSLVSLVDRCIVDFEVFLDELKSQIISLLVSVLLQKFKLVKSLSFFELRCSFLAT